MTRRRLAQPDSEVQSALAVLVVFPFSTFPLSTESVSSSPHKQNLKRQFLVLRETNGLSFGLQKPVIKY